VNNAEKFNISEIKDFEQAVNIFSEAFKNDPMHLLIFPDDSSRLEMVKAIYRFVVYNIAPELNYNIKGLEINNELIAVIIFTTPESKKEWTPVLISEGEKAGRITGERYVTMIREYALKAMRNRPKSPHFYINELAVSPEYQGKGYGKALMKYIENLSNNHSLSTGIALDTSNPENVKMYEHLGYNITYKFRFHGIKGYSMFKPNH
jgi:ribosomal protein S18 acetylase RimI-like enzyme